MMVVEALLATRSLHPLKRWLLFINIAGGLGVLASYAWGLSTHPGSGALLWSGTPAAWQRLSTANMLPAALGYVAFTTFLLLQPHPERHRIFGHLEHTSLLALYIAVLLPSAAWMPLTFAALASPSPILAWSIRALLALIALASLGLLFAVGSLRVRRPAWAWRLAVVGCAVFCLQTVLFDAVIWSAYFRP